MGFCDITGESIFATNLCVFVLLFTVVVLWVVTNGIAVACILKYAEGEVKGEMDEPLLNTSTALFVGYAFLLVGSTGGWYVGVPVSCSRHTTNKCASLFLDVDEALFVCA